MKQEEPAIGPIGVSMMLASVIFLAAGIAWPHAADALLRVMLATLPVGYVAARAYEALLPVRRAQDVRTPFDGAVAPAVQQGTPQVLRTLSRTLLDANHAQLAQRTAVPWSARTTVVAEAARRLGEHHGLDLHDPAHHPAIRALVSPATWQLIAPDDAHESPLMALPAATLSQLDPILDDVERL